MALTTAPHAAGATFAANAFQLAPICPRSMVIVPVALARLSGMRALTVISLFPHVDRLPSGYHIIARQIAKARELSLERQFDGADRTVTLLADDHFRFA